MKRLVFSALVPMVWLLAPSGAVLADNFVVGISSNTNVLLNSAANWTVIRELTVTIPLGDAGAHGCVLNASADMDNPSGDSVSQYLFVVSHNDTNPTTGGGSERMLELIDNSGVNDPDSKPVSTTRHWTGLRSTNGVNGTNVHHFYFLGRKVDPGDLNADVLDASFNGICVETP